MKDEKYLELLAEKYPTEQAVCREIINLKAILGLPKGTEHFMSDLHGEYEAFCHILNNCSGVIREKVDLLFEETLSDIDREEICTLIYYPVEKLEMMKKESRNNEEWYRVILGELIEIARLLSSKYTRSKVRKAMPDEYAYILDELIHVQKDEDDNQVAYHQNIIDTLLELDSADAFIEVLAALIKRLAVDHLHIVGDIFDRGPCADRIMDLLMNYHSLDIEWGNHDILWMGAAAGSEACIATVIRNNLKYHNIRILENSYGISLRDLTLFAEKLYPDTEPMEAALKAISVLLFKLEGQVILRNPDYQMTDKLLLHQVNVQNHTVCIAGTDYEICEETFPTVSFGPSNPEVSYELTAEEKQVMEGLRMAFVGSVRLRQHMDFLYQKGSMYRIFNGNLLFHGCVPLDESGNLEGVVFHQKRYRGRDYLDYAERIARRAWSKDATQKELDFMWYLWCGRKSPLSGRNIKTFERTYVKDESTWHEASNPYYQYYEQEKICNMILHEFNLYSDRSHIINGHTPVRTSRGEHPVRANGRLMVIDGGFCKSYHKTTGIAGYTLIFNSHGIRIKSHQPFQSVYAALTENKDIESRSELVETERERLMVRNTDTGKKILEDIKGLKMLLQAYREGTME
ncbi:fructose-1,6-bisphosphatase [Faecalicatena fissicatena]|uniref:fructose-1,6-bisphosphatase n=1 Tax=Faecalicatena fissicatena TaxID=290055 RepID=UPI00156FAE53|nr:fructose-1,6-bisphosphatase [Faecalicatena fissicatena]NSE34033.1 fructose-1,6-bisphosphatase [Faecalicatena fissicatena]